MSDILIRGMVCSGEAQIIAVSAKGIVDAAIAAHDLSPTPAAALGRTMMAALMMAQELKNDNDGLAIKIKGGGAVGSIDVESANDSTVCGCVSNAHAEAEFNALGKLNVGEIVGHNGTITVSRSNGENPPYVGVCELVSGEIAEDITRYYFESEQKTTAVALGVLLGSDAKCHAAGGIMIHLLPNASEQTIVACEAAVAQLSAISSKITQMSIKQLAYQLFSDLEIMAEATPQFKCKCSSSSVMGVIATLPSGEVENIIEEQGFLEIKCSFCGKKYKFSKKDLLKL